MNTIHGSGNKIHVSRTKLRVLFVVLFKLFKSLKNETPLVISILAASGDVECAKRVQDEEPARLDERADTEADGLRLEELELVVGREEAREGRALPLALRAAARAPPVSMKGVPITGSTLQAALKWQARTQQHLPPPASTPANRTKRPLRRSAT